MEEAQVKDENMRRGAGAGLRKGLSRVAQSSAYRIIKGTWKSVSADNISLLAAGVAFYALLAIFPALAFFVAMFGLWFNPAYVQAELAQLRDVLPHEAWTVINNELLALMNKPRVTLSLASSLSLALALINARLAAYAMMSALNVVYGCKERRSFFTINVVALLLTLAALVVISMSILAAVSAPKLFSLLGLSDHAHQLVHDLRWPVLALIMMIGLAVTYRFGPDRDNAHWHWVTLGSLLALVLWLLGISGFSWYVSYFNSFDRLYGSLGALIVLLYWLWVSAFAALMGAALDRQIIDEIGRKQ